MGEVIEGERLEIKWIHNRIEQLELRDQLSMTVFKNATNTREWQVSVKLISPKIRNDPRAVTLDSKKFSIK